MVKANGNGHDGILAPETQDTSGPAPNRATRFVARWRRLCNEQSGIDYEMARLADEVRKEFPKGASGDGQFRSWTRRHLDVTGPTALRLLHAVKALHAFPVAESWLKLGGWDSISFLTGFKTSDRNKIVAAALKRSDELGRNLVGFGVVRALAGRMGLQSQSPLGRPSRSQQEEAIAVLRTFIASLYENPKLAALLPPMPESVRAAMHSSRLALIAEAVKGRRKPRS